MTKAQFVRGHRLTDISADERPREKLLEKGDEYLTDAELIAVALRVGAAGRNAIELARDLLAIFDNDLSKLAAAPSKQLIGILPGIGPAKVAQLKAQFAVARRLAQHQREDRSRLLSPDDAADHFRERLRGLSQEELHAVYLNVRNEIIGEQRVTLGLADRTAVHAREVYRQAILTGAVRLILVHNHPSGDPSPSQGDVQSTRELHEAGKIIGIELVDHVIIGDRTKTRKRDFVSLRELGYI
jgi:DNA repair protein RadC